MVVWSCVFHSVFIFLSDCVVVLENCRIFAVRKTANVSRCEDFRFASTLLVAFLFVYQSSTGEISPVSRFATLHLCLMQQSTSDL